MTVQGLVSRGTIVNAGKSARLPRSLVTAQLHAYVRFRRAIWMAEDAARERPHLPLEDALQLVHLYAGRGSPKYEKAALRWLGRYLDEDSPTLR